MRRPSSSSWLTLLLRYWIAWLLLFQAARLLFLVYEADKVQPIATFQNIVHTFSFGWRQDMSAAVYMSVLPLLLLWAEATFGSPLFRYARALVHLILVAIVSSLVISDLELFRAWGSKINAMALDLAPSWRETTATALSSPLLLLGCCWLLMAALGYVVWKYAHFSHRAVFIPHKRCKAIVNIAAVAAVLALLVIGARGGIQLAPLNPSAAYFSEHGVLNQAALNTAWNFFYSVSKRKKDETPHFMDNATAQRIVDELYDSATNDSIISVLNTKQPNIILVVMESWTADIVESLGGDAGVSPQFEQLIAEGLLFDNIYSSGDRTYKGIVSVLAAYPAQPNTAIVNYPEKTVHLASITQSLKKIGYGSNFYYGGESEFANIKSFLLNCGFEHITDRRDFGSEAQGIKWGAHDHFVLQRALDDLKRQPQEKPFFCTILTLSSHEPFDVPMETAIAGSDAASMFKNSVFYTDKSIGEWIAKAKEQPWFDNTLFVFVADHGHQLPRGYDNNYTPLRFRIPLLWYGGALQTQWRGKRWHILGSQTDIATTLLQQINPNMQPLKWSKNLLSTQAKEFAFYSFYNGFAWLRPKQYFVLNNDGQKMLMTEPSDSVAASVLEEGKAYMQMLQDDFMHR